LKRDGCLHLLRTGFRGHRRKLLRKFGVFKLLDAPKNFASQIRSAQAAWQVAWQRDISAVYWQLYPKTLRVCKFLRNLELVAWFLLAWDASKQYRVSWLRKLMLAMRIIGNRNKVTALTFWPEQLWLAKEVLRVPATLKGDVVECGSYFGASTASLSLVCALTGRRLIVCDTFEGLPPVRPDEKYDIIGDCYYAWECGDFAADIEDVKRNVEVHGVIEVCRFVKGNFAETLRNLNDVESVVLVFEDADLRSSVEQGLRWLWPKLADGCKFATHEAWSVPVVSIFFDKRWWRSNLKTEPPGFYGSGTGTRTELGYAVKVNKKKLLASNRRRCHLGCRGYSATREA